MNYNRSNPGYFEFTLFVDFGNLRYLLFVLCLFIYAAILSANIIIIAAIFQEKSLHEPMFILICCLSVNSLYGSAGFFPRFLYDLLSETHFISRPSCFVQIYVIYTYAFAEFGILGIMAYDRLVAICQPLHYHIKMTVRKSIVLWAVAISYPAISVCWVISLTIQLPLCRHKLDRIFCANRGVVDNSCIDTSHVNIAGHIVVFTSIFIPFFFVLYSYVRILIVCRRGSADMRSKALQTCGPHLMTFVIYSCSVFLELVISKYSKNPVATAALSLEYLMVPSLGNTLIYGLKLPQIRTAVMRRFKIKTLAPKFPL